MGALILTKGTRRLMHWYNNKCFDKNSLQGTRDAIAGDSTLLSLFSTPTGNTAVIQQILHNTTGASIFLPPHHPSHPHLLQRWDYFLGSVLTYANHELLRNYLWNAINNGITQAGDAYTAIVVDCVEGTSQTVLQSDAYLTDDPDDEALDPSTAYSQITLVTQAMSTQTPVSLDPQFQATLRRRRRDGKGKGKGKKPKA